MTLEKQDAELFYELWFPLLDFVNQKYRVCPGTGTIDRSRGVDAADAKKIADYLWSHTQVLQEYIAYAKLPEEFVLPPQEIILEESSVQSLFDAFAELMDKRREEKQREINSQEVMDDRFTIRRQLVKIRDVLRDKVSVPFEELFEDDAPKMEMIVTFMALLDMLMRGEISIKQPRPYEKITITAKELREDDEDAEYMDEQ